MKKNIIYFLSCLVLAVGLVSCSDDNKEPLLPLSVLIEGGETQEIVQGGTLNLKAEVEGSSEVEYVWKLNGKDVSTASTYDFTATELGSYDVQLTVSNAEQGEASAKVTVDVYGKYKYGTFILNEGSAWGGDKGGYLIFISPEGELVNKAFQEENNGAWLGSEYYVPIQKTMEVLNDLKAQGKIKAIGAANVDIKQIQEYLKWGELDIVQAKYSILDRGIEDEIIPCCRENGVTIQAYSPLEMGLLSGTFPRDYKPVGAQIPKKWFQPENMQKAMDVMDQWKPLCEKYNCTIANLALAWILAQGDFINLLSGSTTVDQIAENVKSAELELDSADVAMMRDMVEAIDK